MKIKTFIAPSMQEGMVLIRKEMGANAVIIDTKKRRQKGFMGFFQPRLLEITAAVDGEAVQAAPEVQEIPEMAAAYQLLDEELNQIKSMVRKLAENQARGTAAQKENGISEYWLNRLVDNDVDRDYAVEILNAIQAASKGKKLKDDFLHTVILNAIKNSLKTCRIPPDTKYVSFVGPTGVGKTTTLAKLAADFHFKKGKKVAMITVDTYRIGAVDQLRTYAEITGIPLEVVYSVKEMPQALESFSDCDLVFIDTAGRSAKNSLQIAEMAQYINSLENNTVFLVISATTKLRDLHRIAQAYRRSNYNGLIVTKIDETETYGTILNLSRLTKLPIAYITVGQNVPDDIEPADAGRLAQLVLGEDFEWQTRPND